MDRHRTGEGDGAETMPTPTPPPSPLMAVAPHYVELNFSRRSAVAVRRDASIAAEVRPLPRLGRGFYRVLSVPIPVYWILSRARSFSRPSFT